jgi:hypothetical protein
MFKDFYHQVGMKVAFPLVYHLQSNGVVERANALIFEVIKKILEGEKKNKWVDVMPRAIFSHNTMVRRATNFTTFPIIVRSRSGAPEEIKHWRLHTTVEVPPCPNKAEEKDFLESNMLKVIANLQKYWDEQGLGAIRRSKQENSS